MGTRQRNAGFIIAVIGGIVGLLSFFVMPYLSFAGYITATGQQLASLGYQISNFYGEYAGGQQFNALELLWLILVIAGLITLIAGVQLFRRGNVSGGRAAGGLVIALAVIALVGLLAAYVYISGQLQSSTNGMVSFTSFLGAGLWVFMLAMIAAIVRRSDGNENSFCSGILFITTPIPFYSAAVTSGP